MFWRKVKARTQRINSIWFISFFVSVGIIKYVKTQCTPQINAYDKCLQENTEDPRNCIPVFKELYLCTEAASVTFNEEQQKK